MARRPLNEIETSRRRRVSARAVVRTIAALAVVVVAGGASLQAGAMDRIANTVRPVAGAPSYGMDKSTPLNDNLVALASTPTGKGYWVAAADGGVFARGDARFYGSAGSLKLTRPVVGITATPGGDGYWLVAADGGIFAYGSARFSGSLGGRRINGSIRAIAATPTGRGYWMLGSDGGVFTFGDAKFYGSAASNRRAAPFVSMARTRTGRGYYLLGADGGVFTHGDAKFRGAAVDGHLATSISLARMGDGYQVARTDGSVRGFGGQPSIAAPRDVAANQHPVVSIASRPGGGAWLVHGYNPPPPPKPKPKVRHRDLSQDPFLKCTRAHESDSAGGYRAVSSGGVYRGAYQFLRSTWNNVARRAGRFDLVGVDPAAAAPADQDEIAWFLFQWQGRAPWGGRCAGLS